MRDHSLLICRGECPFADKHFVDDLHDTARRVVEDLLSLDDDNVQQTQLRISLCHYNFQHQWRSVPLVDQLLADGLRLSFPPGQNNDCDIEAFLFEIVSRIIQRTDFTVFTAELQLLVWCLVQLEVSEALEEVLAKGSNLIPRCSMTSLLLKAIRLNWGDGVELLLNYGAESDVTLRLGDQFTRPICSCMMFIWNLADDAIRQGRLIISSNEGDGDEKLPEKPRNLVRILKLLLKKNEESFNLQAFTEDRMAFNYLGELALVSPEAVVMLLDAAGPFMNANMASSSYLSPLLTALQPYRLLLRQPAQPSNAQLAAKLFKFGVLPILRAGARFSGDKWLQQAAICVDPNEPTISYQLWGRADVVLLIFIEGISGVSPSWNNETNSQLEAKIRPLFPRPLLQLSRRAILATLQLGLTARTSAIAQLPLPDSLKLFLNFCEFDVLSDCQKL